MAHLALALSSMGVHGQVEECAKCKQFVRANNLLVQKWRQGVFGMCLCFVDF